MKVAGDSEENVARHSGWGMRPQVSWMSFLRAAAAVTFPPPPTWASGGEVVAELSTMQLREFGSGDGIPVLVVAPFAGHSSTVADFADGQSLVQVYMKAGFHTYCTDWKSATYEMKDYGIGHYLTDLWRAVDKIGGRAHLVGLCQGGWISALFAATYPEMTESITIAGTPLNTQAGDGRVKRLANEHPIEWFGALVAAGGGLMRGKLMLAGWKAMHSYENYCGKYVDLFEKCEDEQYLERTKRFASWYETVLDLPGRFYLEAVETLFQQNRLYEDGWLGKITCPVYLVAGESDDITPPEQVFSAAEKFTSAPVLRKMLVPGGHVGMFMSSRSIKNYWPQVVSGMREHWRSTTDRLM